MTKKSSKIPANILSIPKSEPVISPMPPEQLFETVFMEDPGPVTVFLIVKPNISVQPEHTFGGRVGFRLTGTHEDMKAAFEALQNDKPIGCRTLLNELRRVRTAMFVCKQGK